MVNPTIQCRNMIYGLAKNLPENKYQVTILHPTPSKKTSEQFEGKIKIIKYPSLFIPKINYTLPIIPKKLEILSNLMDNDIIQVGDYFYPTSIPPLISSRNESIPKILSINALPGYNWKYGNKMIDLIAGIYTHSIGKKIINRYDKIIAIYNKLGEDTKNLGIDPQKIEVIHSGVEIERFQKFEKTLCDKIRNQFSINENDKVILYVGRLAQVKRVEVVLWLAKKFKGNKVKTIIVGDGPLLNFYRKLSGNDNDIIFTGLVPKTIIPAFYYISNVLILPSLSEGLPNVLLECAASSKPAISTNVNGIPDIINHGKTGFSVDPYDFESFYKYTKIILDNKEIQDELGKNAFNKIKKKFNWNNTVEKYEKLYRETLS